MPKYRSPSRKSGGKTTIIMTGSIPHITSLARSLASYRSMNPDAPNEPGGWEPSSVATTYYLCTTVLYPHGTGSACYECVNGVFTSPLTGATGVCPCTPWWQGGNCYGWLHTANIPSNMPFERACGGHTPGYGYHCLIS